MKRVFEPLELDLGDARLLPNRVIEIQEKVGELISVKTNRHRRDALTEELKKLGAWALPGLINATMVFGEKMKDIKIQEEVAEIIFELARDNLAAKGLLIRSGVYENPFYESRQIILRAIDSLGWKPENPQEIRRLINRLRKEGEDAWLCDVYRLYLKVGLESAFEEGMELCENWLRRPLDIARELLKQLILAFPDRGVEILSRAFIAVTEISNDARKDKGYAEKLVREIPQEKLVHWIKDGTLVEISNNVLSVLVFTSAPRHKAVEEMWKLAVKYLVRDGDLDVRELDGIREFIIRGSQGVHDGVAESIFRYWMQALGNAGASSYVVAQVDYENEPLYQKQAVVQLFFLPDIKAKQRLSDLEKEKPYLYQECKETYERITTTRGKKTSIEESKARRGSDIKE
ncbi:MAG: hypothetical protein QXT77_09850 [Candidatus Methanomethylicaceae archaeon]